MSMYVFLDYQKRKSIVSKVYHIDLLKISPFYLCYDFFDAFEFLDDSYHTNLTR